MFRFMKMSAMLMMAMGVMMMTMMKATAGCRMKINGQCLISVIGCYLEKQENQENILITAMTVHTRAHKQQTMVKSMVMTAVVSSEKTSKERAWLELLVLPISLNPRALHQGDTKPGFRELAQLLGGSGL